MIYLLFFGLLFFEELNTRFRSRHHRCMDVMSELCSHCLDIAFEFHSVGSVLKAVLLIKWTLYCCKTSACLICPISWEMILKSCFIKKFWWIKPSYKTVTERVGSGPNNKNEFLNPSLHMKTLIFSEIPTAVFCI